MAVALGLARLWYDNHEDIDFQNTSKVKTGKFIKNTEHDK
jgi:hypothetical protein